MACFTKVFKREKKSYDLPVVAVLNVERTPQEFSTYRRWNSFLDGRTEAKDQSKNERSESGFDSISEQAIQEVSEAANIKVVIPAKPTRAPPKIPIQEFSPLHSPMPLRKPYVTPVPDINFIEATPSPILKTTHADFEVKIDELNVATRLSLHKRKEGVLSDKINQKDNKLVEVNAFHKDDESMVLIRNAIMANDFLNNILDADTLETVVQTMEPLSFEENSMILTEGNSGSHFYVSAQGKFQVLIQDKVIKSFGPGVVFGELAILYKAKRFASIKAITSAKIWRLERKVFRRIMVQSGRKIREENVKFLSSVPVLKDLSEDVLFKISDLLQREFYPAGTMIIRQGDPGDKFYIIRGGSVNVVKGDSIGERMVGVLRRGAYFGEQALLHQDKRLASIIANPPGTECLTLDTNSFVNHLGSLEMIKNSKMIEQEEPEVKPRENAHKTEFSHVQLTDLKFIGTLGVGGFGRVELVQYKTGQTFALKCLKKIEMLQQQQIEHAYSEKEIMYACCSPFIVRLYNTYKNATHVFLLMEACLSGDVWTILQKQKNFDEKTSKFMAACVVEALDYLHTKNIIYRDMKPENLMLDEHGYIKLVDFGFAKIIKKSQKTFTFAGTPEYVCPEIILNKGHDHSVDYWALGVFIHEILVGKPPFRGKNHMKTYNLILRGIDSVQMPTKVPKKAQLIIKRLCRQTPTERLGCQKNGIMDIRNHGWFSGFDWNKLKSRKMIAPLIPTVKNNTDLSNFDEYPSERDDTPEETSGWDEDF